MSDRGGPITAGKETAPDWRDRRIRELEAELGQARAENAALKARIAELERRLAELERSAKRQATPFARGEHKADPKKPGRKAGQGLFSYRAKPTPDAVDETKEVRLDRTIVDKLKIVGVWSVYVKHRPSIFSSKIIGPSGG